MGERATGQRPATPPSLDLEVRVRYLRTDSLSRDLLEERARAVLGFSDPRDYVIRVSAQKPVSTVASAS